MIVEIKYWNGGFNIDKHSVLYQDFFREKRLVEYIALNEEVEEFKKLIQPFHSGIWRIKQRKAL